MTATKLKNKYPILWAKVYNNMITDLQLNVTGADVAQYKNDDKNSRISTIAHNSAFIACSAVEELLNTCPE